MSNFTLRPYQKEAVDAHMDFFLDRKKNHNEISILPTGSGKSLIIAETAHRLGEPCLVFQPSKEILEQNVAKFESYGYKAGVYSASAGRKDIQEVTFATIGSVVGKGDLFKSFKYIMVDECHGVNSKTGMYKNFLSCMGNTPVLGLTATPYRLTNDLYNGAMLKFLTRTRPAVFQNVRFVVQNKTLFDAGYLSKLEYYDIPGFDRSRIKVNSTGADYDERSLAAYLDEIDFEDRLIKVVNRIHKIRKASVVFTSFVKQADSLARAVPGVEVISAQTPAKRRSELLDEWRKGQIQTLANVGILTTGVDYPQLDTVILARPTRSLALYYQQIGRGLRIHPDKKETFIVDMTSNFENFGKVEDFHIGPNKKSGLWELSVNGKALTNVPLGR